MLARSLSLCSYAESGFYTFWCFFIHSSGFGGTFTFFGDAFDDDGFFIPALANDDLLAYLNILARLASHTINVNFSSFNGLFGLCSCFKKASSPKPFIQSYFFSRHDFSTEQRLGRSGSEEKKLLSMRLCKVPSGVKGILTCL